jgi:hypothetical protein
MVVLGAGMLIKRRITMDNWHYLIQSEMDNHGDSFDNVEANTMVGIQMLAPFDSNAGLRHPNGCPFTVWTTARVYFPLKYDGREWVGSVSRNPNGVPTPHQGG